MGTRKKGSSKIHDKSEKSLKIPRMQSVDDISKWFETLGIGSLIYRIALNKKGTNAYVTLRISLLE